MGTAGVALGSVVVGMAVAAAHTFGEVKSSPDC